MLSDEKVNEFFDKVIEIEKEKSYQQGRADAYNEVYDKMNDADIDEFIDWLTGKAMKLESEETE